MSFSDLDRSGLRAPSFTNRTPSYSQQLSANAGPASEAPGQSRGKVSAHSLYPPFKDSEEADAGEDAVLGPLIAKIKGQLQTLQVEIGAVNKLVLLVGTDRDTAALREELHGRLEETNALVREVNGQMKELARHTAGMPHSAEGKLKQTRLSSDFARALKQFQELQRSAAAKTKAFVARAKHDASLSPTRTHGGGSSSVQGYRDDNDDGADEDEDEEEEQKRQLIVQMEPQVQYNQALIEEREREIKDIEQSIMQVNDIFRDLNVIVNEQQGHFDNIEDNIFQARDHVSNANNELTAANNYQKKARRKKLIIFLGLVVIITVIVLISVLTAR